MQPIRTMHLFAGAGGGLLADVILGHTPVCAVEINTHCQQVLSARQKDGCLPWFPIFPDVQKFDGAPWHGLVDCLLAGFPCQDLSVAGKGAGLDGEKSGLWREVVRILRDVGPGYALLENSPALTSRGLDVVLRDLAECGYDAVWCVLGSGTLGAWHNRQRIWILAFDPLRVRVQGPWQRQRLGETRPWREISPEHLRAALEDPINAQGAVQPLLHGTEYGLADWVERVHAIGNGQVSSVAALAWRTLTGQR